MNKKLVKAVSHSAQTGFHHVMTIILFYLSMMSSVSQGTSTKTMKITL